MNITKQANPLETQENDYKTTYKGMLQEVHHRKAKETYGHITFNTSTNSIIAIDTLAPNNELIDPVAFAYDFGARMYDARVGKFLSVDPFPNPNEGAYSFAGDNPIYFIDYEGGFKMSPWFIKRYPTLAKLLAYEIPKLINNESLRNEWIKKMRMDGSKESWDLGKKLWKEMLTWGKGPYVTPQRPSSEQINQYNQALGHFFSQVPNDGGEFRERDYPNNLIIGRSPIDELESSLSRNNDLFTFSAFKLISLIFHEAGHWARFNAFGVCSSDPKTEDGALAEEAFFGQRYSYIGTNKYSNNQNATNYKLMENDFNKNHKYIPKINMRMYNFVFNNYPVPSGQKGDPSLSENGDNESANPPKTPNPERIGETSNGVETGL